MRRSQCLRANVSSVQIQGDADYFINHLGIPTVQLAYEDIKTLEVIVPKHVKCSPRCSRCSDFILTELCIHLSYQIGHRWEGFHHEVILLLRGFVSLFEKPAF